MPTNKIAVPPSSAITQPLTTNTQRLIFAARNLEAHAVDDIGQCNGCASAWPCERATAAKLHLTKLRRP